MNDKELLQKILEGTSVEDKNYWLEQCNSQESVPMTMLLEREAWKGVIAPEQNEWIEETIDSLRSRIGRDDLYAKAFLPEKPNLLAALEHIKQSDVDLSAVSHVVRESQKALLYWMFSLLDGGHSFEDSLDSNWGVFEFDDELEPKRQLMMFRGTAHEFDPKPEK